MTNEEKIKAVAAWQADERIHPLTCGNDSRHTLLVAAENGNEVILKCLDCDYVQVHIPPVVYENHLRRRHDSNKDSTRIDQDR